MAAHTAAVATTLEEEEKVSNRLVAHSPHPSARYNILQKKRGGGNGLDLTLCVA